MNKNQKIIDAVFRAIDQLNLTFPPDKKIERSLDIELSGPSGALDSLGLVNLVVETEQQIEETFGVLVNLADEKAMSAEPSPFKTILNLVQYIDSLLRAELGGVNR
jgi:acyl carrier protein